MSNHSSSIKICLLFREVDMYLFLFIIKEEDVFIISDFCICLTFKGVELNNYFSIFNNHIKN